MDKQQAMMEKINPDYPEGLQEIADMLTFLPEEMRMTIAMAFVSMAVTS